VNETTGQPSADAAGLIARLEAAPFSRWHIRPRLVMGSATFFDAFDALQLASALLVLRGLWSLTPADIGWLISASYIGQLAGARLFGRLAERVGRVPAAAGAVLLMSVMSLVCAFTGNFAQLFACRLVQGIGVGGEMPVAAAYISELSRAKGRGRFFLAYELIFPVGLLVTGILGAFLVPRFGWQSMFVVGGIPGLIIAVMLLRLPESPRWLISKGRLPEADQIIREIEAAAPLPRGEAPKPALAPAGTVAERSRWRELLSPFYRRRTLVVWVLWATAYFVTNGLNNWMPTFYNTVYHLNLQNSLLAAPLTNAAQVALLLLCLFVIDRIGRRVWTMACFLAGAVLLGLLSLFGSGSVVAALTLATLAYGLIGSVNAVLYLYTPEIYPTRMRAAATGAATCWLRAASAIAPILVGRFMMAEGISAVFMLFAGIALVGAVASAGMLETRNRRLEDLAP
jgi:putative MFS transporter